MVAWIDKYKEDKVRPEKIFDFDFEKIVIAIKKPGLAEIIVNELIDMGVNKNKILWKA